MTHLVTRLRALADDITGPSSAWAQTDVIADAILEAADGLELCKSRLLELAEEILDLKAKLADAVSLLEHSRDCHVETAKRTEKAEAEAAALREAALTWFKLLEDSATWKEAEKAEKHFEKLLSQPGSGAALLEELQDLREALQLFEAHGHANKDRVKKLEAAAEANNATLGAACDNLKAAQKLVEHNFKAVAKERDEARAEAAALAHRLTLMGEALIYCRTSGHEVARVALERDEAETETDALASRMTSIIDPNIRALEREVDALKAKLAEAKGNALAFQEGAEAWQERAEKAEAEAAALKKALQDMNVTGWRELRDKADIAIAEVAALRDIAQDLCDFNAKYLDEMRSKETWAVEGTLEESPFVTRFRHALSQPGPGAAYQERLRETESKFATQSHNLNVMNERLKKLEAVAEAVVECRKIDRIVMGDIMTPTVINMSPFKRLEDALAALEEKA